LRFLFGVSDKHFLMSGWLSIPCYFNHGFPAFFAPMHPPDVPLVGFSGTARHIFHFLSPVKNAFLVLLGYKYGTPWFFEMLLIRQCTFIGI